MAIINVTYEEDELTCQVANDFGVMYSLLRNTIYSDNSSTEGNATAYVQLAHSFIDMYQRLLEYIPDVKVYRELFKDGVLDPENCEVLTINSEHEDYPKILLGALCNRYKEALTTLLVSASEKIQTNPRQSLFMVSESDVGYHNKDSALATVQMFDEIRQFVFENFVHDVTVFDYIINVAPILDDNIVCNLIWKRYLKHNAKQHRDLAINNMVVGKMMVTDDMDAYAKQLDDAFEFVSSDNSVELDESSLLYYKLSRTINNKVMFEHRLGPYAQALFRNDTQAILSTPVIEGNIERTDVKFGFRSKFIPVNMPTGESFKDVKCEGLLAKFAS